MDLAAFFGRILLAVDYVPDFERRMAEATPLARYAAFLIDSLKRFRRCEALRAAHPTCGRFCPPNLNDCSATMLPTARREPHWQRRAASLRTLDAFRSERRVRDRELACRPRLERSCLTLVESFAGPVPVDRDDVAGSRRVDEPEAVLPAADRLGPGSAKPQLAVAPLERDGVDEKVASDPVADGAPPDPAAVDRAQDVAGRLTAEETGDGEDVEDVKAWTGCAPTGAFVASQLQADPRSRGRKRVSTEAPNAATGLPRACSPPSQ